MMHQVLKAGQSMIGLQYGTNKGASQVSIFLEYSTERGQWKRTQGNIFPLFRLVWLPMEPPGRSGQRVSSFICHQLLTQNCIVLDFGQALFFTILLSYFGIPIHLQNYLIELPINQTRCSCQWKVLLWIAKKQWRHSRLFCNCLFLCGYFSSIRWAFCFERCLSSNHGWCLSSTFCLEAIIKMGFKSVPSFQRQQL